MKRKRQITIRLNSNVKKYAVSMCDYNGNFCTSEYNQNDCINLCTDAVALRLIARPLNGQSNTTHYFKLDLKCNNFFELYFGFPNKVPIYQSENTFYLTDRNYGLKINGALMFSIV